MCCDSWGLKELDTTERLNLTELNSPVDHVLSELSTITSSSWEAVQGMAHSFIE